MANFDYQSMLNQANEGYQQALQGYGIAMNTQRANARRIQRGYANLQQSVLNDIQGIGRAKSQEIADTYARESGAMQQNLARQGLGGWSVMPAMQRGLTLDSQKAQAGLAEQIAQLRAGYQTNLGLARLGYMGQANRENTALFGQRAGMQASIAGKRMDTGVHLAGLQQQFDLAMLRGGGGGGGGGYGGGYAGTFDPLGSDARAREQRAHGELQAQRDWQSGENALDRQLRYEMHDPMVPNPALGGGGFGGDFGGGGGGYSADPYGNPSEEVFGG